MKTPKYETQEGGAIMLSVDELCTSYVTRIWFSSRMAAAFYVRWKRGNVSQRGQMAVPTVLHSPNFSKSYARDFILSALFLRFVMRILLVSRLLFCFVVDNLCLLLLVP